MAGSSQKKTAAVILGCFFFSGAAGLVYQVVWTRLLTLVFGGTVYAISTVLAAFMGGLALGSLAFGRWADRSNKNPLLIYAWLEFLIGVYCLTTPWSLGFLRNFYAQVAIHFDGSPFLFGLFRLVLVSVVLVPPTIAMGATFPILCLYYTESLGHLGARVGRLYSANTWGAVLGTFLAGFVLVPYLGVRAALFTGVLLNTLVAGLVYLVYKFREAGVESAESADQVTPSQAEAEPKGHGIILAGFACSGMFALSYEIVWTRVLQMTIGTTVYVFSTMLIAFLVGIALGSAVASKWADKLKRRLLAFGLLEITIGLITLPVLWALTRAPLIFLSMYSLFEQSFLGYTLATLAVSCIVLIPQALLFGATFPLVSKLVTDEMSRLGSSIGYAYFVNTVGSIAGSLLTGFLLIPFLGTEKTLLVLASGAVVLGSILVAFSEVTSSKRLTYSLGALGILAAALFFREPWDPVLMSSGLYSKPNLIRQLGKEKFLQALSQMKILYMKEGVNAHVSVVEGRGQRAIRINGKVVATTTAIDMANQMALAHIPMLLDKDPQKTMIVGLGAGVTAGHLAAHKPKTLDIVEIEPAVLGASKVLSDINHSPWEQEGVNLVYADGRNFVLAGEPGYDVITSDPIHPYAQGAGSLYTVEHFRNCAKLLKEDGVMAQWLPLYGMSEEDSKSIVASFCEVFPHASYWVAPNPESQATFKRDAILIGTKTPLEIDIEDLTERLRRPELAELMKPYGWDDPVSFVSGFLMEDDALRAYASDAVLNTDDNPVIEYGAPKGLFLETEGSKMTLIDGAVVAAGDTLPTLKGSDSEKADFLAALAEKLKQLGRDAQARKAEMLSSR